ncbi:energy transducer TonB [Methylibium rhizosphaerae]|uniref:energy transducer TonB n=1 Tax=Methylibium rhizosphaerae TaxID=2570323 RepID=UPI0015E4868F|nr:TonB family protein [Methylibium rhizosphaerae]
MRFPNLSRTLYCALLLSAGDLQAAAAQPDPSTDPRFAEAAERARLEGDKVFQRILINGQLPKRAAPAAADPAPAAANTPPAPAKRAATPPPNKAASAATPRPQTGHAESPLRNAGTPAPLAVQTPATPPTLAASAAPPSSPASAQAPAVPSDGRRPLAAETRSDTQDRPTAAASQAVEPEQDQPLILLHQVDPDFPAAIVRRQKKGVVTLRFEVQVDGSVNQPEVIRSSNPRLNPAALAAVAQWKFEPLSRPQSASAELAFDLHQSFDQ